MESRFLQFTDFLFLAHSTIPYSVIVVIIDSRLLFLSSVMRLSATVFLTSNFLPCQGHRACLFFQLRAAALHFEQLFRDCTHSVLRHNRNTSIQHFFLKRFTRVAALAILPETHAKLAEHRP